MQILKAILLACALVVATRPVHLQAADTAGQAAARAALQEKMRELKGPAPAVAAPAVSPTVASEPAPAAAARAADGNAAPAPFVLPEGASPDLIEQARQANRASRAELERQQKLATQAKRKKTPPPPVSKPSRKEKAAPAAAPEHRTVKAQPEADKNSGPDLIEQARQATRDRMAELQNHKHTAIPVGQEAPAASAPPTATPVVTTSVKAAAPTAAELRASKAREAAEKKAGQAQIAKAKAEADADKKAQAAVAPQKTAKPAKKSKPAAATVEAAASLAPLEGPPSSLPARKEQLLHALLEQYKADKISAEEYHEQRAKILAEP